MGISKAYKRKKRRRVKNGGVHHKLKTGRTGSVTHKRRHGLLVEQKKRKPK